MSQYIPSQSIDERPSHHDSGNDGLMTSTMKI